MTLLVALLLVLLSLPGCCIQVDIARGRGLFPLTEPAHVEPHKPEGAK
jgi:hypothetical protein